MFLNRLQLARQVRITNLIGVKVSHAHPHAVFHFACAKIMQKRAPTLVLFEIFGDVPGKQDVSGIPAIHHPLCRVDAASGYVGAFVHVHYTTDGPTVNAHSNLQARIVLECAADLHCTLRRFFRTLVKDQRHAVAGGDL